MIDCPEFLAARHLAAEAIHDLSGVKPAALRVLPNGRIEWLSGGEHMAGSIRRPKLEFAVSVAALLILEIVDEDELGKVDKAQFVERPLAKLRADGKGRKAVNMAEINISLRHGERLHGSFTELVSVYEQRALSSGKAG